MNEAIDTQVEVRGDTSAARVARVYAEALLEEAEQQGATQEVLGDLEALVQDVAGADPLIAAFLGGAGVGRERREAILREAFEGRTHPILFNFLLVLNDHDRTGLLRPVLDFYRGLLEQRTGKVHVYVRSAVPLEDRQRQRLLDDLREALGREPLLEETVDPDLLGGLVVRVGDWLYDASVRTQIENLRDRLLERSSHEIEIGRERFIATATG